MHDFVDFKDERGYSVSLLCNRLLSRDVTLLHRESGKFRWRAGSELMICRLKKCICFVWFTVALFVLTEKRICFFLSTEDSRSQR